MLTIVIDDHHYQLELETKPPQLVVGVKTSSTQWLVSVKPSRSSWRLGLEANKPWLQEADDVIIYLLDQLALSLVQGYSLPDELWLLTGNWTLHNPATKLSVDLPLTASQLEGWSVKQALAEIS